MAQSTPQHTQGPWIVAQSRRIEAADGTAVAFNGDVQSATEYAANARLIAAAPEMLALLRNVAQYGMISPDAWAETLVTARALLAKIEGVA